MRRTSTGVRLVTAAATVLLLVGSAGCSEPQGGSGSAGTPTASPVPPAGSTASSAGAGPSAPATSAPGPATASGAGSTAGSALPPAATTAVPAPTPGSTAETVEASPHVSRKAVKLDKPSTDGAGAVVRITDAKAIAAKAQLPGEVAGPGVALTLEVENESQRTVDLSAVVVTLLDSDSAPGVEMSAKPADPLSGTLRPGKTTTGVYVFTVDEARRSPISISVTLAGAAPVLVFKGDAR